MQESRLNTVESGLHRAFNSLNVYFACLQLHERELERHQASESARELTPGSRVARQRLRVAVGDLHEIEAVLTAEVDGPPSFSGSLVQKEDRLPNAVISEVNEKFAHVDGVFLSRLRRGDGLLNGAGIEAS